MLHHAAKVVPPGRTFLRRMIDTSMLATQNHHHRSRFSVRPTLVEFVPQQLERYSDDPSGTHTLGHSGHIGFMGLFTDGRLVSNPVARLLAHHGERTATSRVPCGEGLPRVNPYKSDVIMPRW